MSNPIPKKLPAPADRPAPKKISGDPPVSPPKSPRGPGAVQVTL
jgi:hypothetical protein